MYSKVLLWMSGVQLSAGEETCDSYLRSLHMYEILG